jgi:hypothetical protein
MKAIIILIASVFFLTGCSVFQPTQKLDMNPFAENTATLFGEAVKISRTFQWKHCKPYTSIPEFQTMFQRAMPIIDVLRGVVYYSNQVVAINNSKLSDSEKNKRLAQYLSETLNKAVENQKFDSLALDKLGTQETFDNIRNAETYLDGISAASPIVNTVVLSVQNRLDELQNGISSILRGFDREIERDYGATKTNFVRLHQLQEQLMLSATRVYRARMGEAAELDSLLQENSSLSQFFSSADKATPAQLASAENYLLGQLNQVDILLHQLDDAKNEYLAKQDELTTWRITLEEKILIARNSMTVWAQSHRNLGAGIPVPPLIDVEGFATGLLGKASRVIIP